MTYKVMGGANKIINSKSRMFLAFCFCFMLGVGCFSFVEAAGEMSFYLFVGIFIVLFGLIIFWYSPVWRLALFGLLFFIGGGLRMLLTVPADGPGEIKHFNGEKIEFIGTVVADWGANTKSVRYAIAADEVIIGKNTKSVHGNVLVDAPPASEFVYGDKLKINCLLESPKIAIDSNFQYDKYLARNGIWSMCRQAKVDFVSANKSFLNKIIVNFLRLRQAVEKQAGRLWPEPEASLLTGILYGARSGLPQDLLNDFNRVGITHIIAVSGYNISIVAVVLLALFIRLGLGRRRAFWAVVCGIILFVLFSGASASVVRAGIMGIIVLLAGQLGRMSRVGNVLVCTAALMLLANPFILIWDAGFQLSFLATLGLVYISPLLENVIARSGATKQSISQHCHSREGGNPVNGRQSPLDSRLRGNDNHTAGLPRFFQSLAMTFVPTMSAIIATLPLILFQFGRLSIVAPVVNVLVLWIIPYLMLFGFLAIILGFIFYPAGQVVAWLALVGLKYLIGVAEWFGSKSWSAMDFIIPWWGMAAMYACMVFIVIKKYNIINNNVIPAKAGIQSPIATVDSRLRGNDNNFIV